MKNLFVGNMSFQTTEADLRALFEPFSGKSLGIHIVNDRETGQPRGFAFVEMAKDDEAAKAMSGLNGKEVAGRALRVNEATPKPERGGPRGNGGFWFARWRREKNWETPWPRRIFDRGLS